MGMSIVQTPSQLCRRKSRYSGFWREHRGQAFAFHGRRLFNLRKIRQLFQDRDDNAPAFFNVLEFAAAEQHINENLVLVFQEFARLVNFGFDVVVAGFGANPDFLELLLVWLVLGFLVRLLVTKLAVVHDLADRRPFGRGDLNQVELSFARQIQGLRCHDDT